jgi:hypothetical protein
VLVLAAALAVCRDAPAYTRNSPEVKALVNKGLAYLETASEHRLGGVCLFGYAFLKAEREITHRWIQDAVSFTQKVAAGGVEAAKREDNYSLGLAIIFLCELDPVKYRPLIQTYVTALLEKQQPRGAWGYPDGEVGDTSQTQYGVLGIWMARSKDILVKQDSIERFCNWLIRTQNVDGGFCYHPIDPGAGNYMRRRQQEPPTHSLTAAGVGSLYIAADLFGFSEWEAKPQDSEVPAALQEVEGERQRKPPATGAVLPAMLVRAINDGNRWFGTNYRINVRRHGLYYLYGLERYQSFRALAEGNDDPEPYWYNDGVDYLARIQASDGSWVISGGEGVAIDTAFALLFLLRSTQEVIEDNVISEGVLRSGRGLPSNTSDVFLKDGSVIRAPIFGEVEDLLDILEDPSNPNFDDLIKFNEQLSLDADSDSRDREIDRLVRLVSEGAWGARKVAVRTLARTGDAKNAAVLIYALSDPDPRVSREARDGLRFISRKFKGFGMPDEASASDKAAAIEKWKQWLRSIQPDASFVD